MLAFVKAGQGRPIHKRIEHPVDNSCDTVGELHVSRGVMVYKVQGGGGSW